MSAPGSSPIRSTSQSNAKRSPARQAIAGVPWTLCKTSMPRRCSGFRNMPKTLRKASSASRCHQGFSSSPSAWVCWQTPRCRKENVVPHKSLTNVVVRQLQNLAQALRVELTLDALRGLETVLQKHDLVDIAAALSAIAEEERGRTHREMPPVRYIVERWWSARTTSAQTLRAGSLAASAAAACASPPLITGPSVLVIRRTTASRNAGASAHSAAPASVGPRGIRRPHDQAGVLWGHLHGTPSHTGRGGSNLQDYGLADRHGRPFFTSAF